MKEKKENVERNNKRIRKLKMELDKIEDAITKQQTTRLLVENTKQIDGVIKELDKRRI
jgi:predicted ribosome quality control (RQC) complex YloA/Tae2 family protein